MNNTTAEDEKDFQAWVVGLRRWFHRNPEPSFAEHAAQKKVMETLTVLGIENRAAGKTGVIGTIRGGKPGPTAGLRSDMDALSIQEAETGLNREYRSQNPGVMHACGHDCHVAILLGAARRLQERRAGLAGNARLIFQPAEEVPPGGANDMIAAGALDGVGAIYAVHVHGGMPLGRIGFRAGPFMALTRSFKVTIKGRPGHHMSPQESIDAIQIAARFIASIHSDLKLHLAPDALYALGFGQVNSGTQHNQTPGEAVVIGTFRTFDRQVSDRILEVMRQSLDGLMRTFAIQGMRGEGGGMQPGAGAELPKSEVRGQGAEGGSGGQPGVENRKSKSTPGYELVVDPAYPVLVNDARLSARAAEVLKKRFPDVDPQMAMNYGGEDFACYAEKVPGLFMFIGSANAAKGITAMNHSDRFDVDEDILGAGVEIMTTLARDYLAGSS
jgi:amidohydrolase